ncbi:MAG: hypothetical protein HY726_17100 [Candidatus Rokubacteria bacterium]|nr:hypothetical protein [Candidatus Rokubacteria bacterium]
MTEADPGLSRRDVLFGFVGILAGSEVLSARAVGAGAITRDQYGDQIQTVPRGELPDFAKSGGPNVGGVYRFALDQGADLEYIPCFCGCGNIGHRHNRDCYVKSQNRDGTVTWTSHGAT